MTVKDRIGRKRYIAFRIETHSTRFFSRDDVIGALRRAAYSGKDRIKPPHLTVFDAPRSIGVVRVKHTDKERAIELLNSIRSIGGRDVKVVTLRTSGTIKSLRERYHLPASRRRKERKSVK